MLMAIIFQVYAPFAKNIVTSVFPEIKHGENPISLTNRSDVLKNNPTKNDLLIKYWKSSCALHPDVFPGVTLEFSGEQIWLKWVVLCVLNFFNPVNYVICANIIEWNKGEMVFYDTTLGKRTYYIGPNDDSPKSLSVSFMATKFNLLTPSEQERIIDHSMKPKSLKKRFLVYAASNCRAHREIAFDALSQIGDVYQGGECWGLKKERSSVKLSTLRFDRDKGSNNNALLYRNYRFALVMEVSTSHWKFLLFSVGIYLEVYRFISKKIQAHDINTPHKRYGLRAQSARDILVRKFSTLSWAGLFPYGKLCCGLEYCIVSLMLCT